MTDEDWQNLISCGTFNVCRCGHFVFKHDGDTGECYGVDVDHHSIRCECKTLNVPKRPKLRVVK